MTTTIIKTAFRRGDVILVLFPNSDLDTAKRRPALIIQADNLQTGLSQYVVAMITSNLARANHTSRVKVLYGDAKGKKSGLLTDSIVMTDNLATVAVFAIERRIGTLSMTEVDSVLKHTLGL